MAPTDEETGPAPADAATTKSPPTAASLDHVAPLLTTTQSIARELLAAAGQPVLETAFEAELYEHLGYPKHSLEARNTGNSRNGTRSKTVLTEVARSRISTHLARQTERSSVRGVNVPYARRVVVESLRTVVAADGRTVAFATWGDPDGFPILALHGTPGCRLERWPREGLYRELGVLFVTHDRAGYARSDRRPGRSIADEVDDVRLLADELGFERFAVTGGSGGGAHALACAALISPERLIRVTCAVGVAPLGPQGLEQDEWLAGMDPENVKEFGWAAAGEEVLAPRLEEMTAKLAGEVEDDPAAVLADFELSESDRAALARPELMQVIRESFREQALGTVGGWVDDDLAHLAPWGFELAQIAVPVLVRYGAADVLVPAAHGAWLAAHVPGCVVKIDGTAGHLAEDPEHEIAENIAWLRDGIPPPASLV